jgi:SAM-dependent methyltransferase
VQISSHLRNRNCPVCGSSDDSLLVYPSRFDEQKLGDFAFASRKFPEFMHLRLLKCQICSVLYASPALSADFLGDAYRDAEYDSNEEANYAAQTYAKILDPLLPTLCNRASALEVGAGNGAFLRHLVKAGFRKVLGIEPSHRAASNAGADVKQLIRLQMFQIRDFEPESISLFCCFQTLEHVENPRSLCSDAFGLLRPNGAIFLVTHDYESLATRILGERSPIFDIEHLQLFSKKSLQYLLESCGFRDVRVENVSNRYPLSYWIKLLPVAPGLKKKIIPVLRSSVVGRLPLKLRVGNIYAVGYKRGLGLQSNSED